MYQKRANSLYSMEESLSAFVSLLTFNTDSTFIHKVRQVDRK